jgi:hypothetical protein
VLCENYLGIFRAVGPPDAEPAFLLFNQKSEEEKIVKQPEEGVAKKKKYFRVEFLPPPVVYSA